MWLNTAINDVQRPPVTTAIMYEDNSIETYQSIKKIQRYPQVEQQDACDLCLAVSSPSLTVSLALPFGPYVALASMPSSYAHRFTTRRVIYSNTSNTPSPVFAEVKNNLGRLSGEDGAESGGGVGGVVMAVLF